jgi:hypothetical protein
VAARSNGAITLSMQVVAPGLMVMAVVYFMGAVGGAHLNPAVTPAFTLRRDFPWHRLPGYIVAQLVGGIGAACFLGTMFGIVGLLGATVPAPDLLRGRYRGELDLRRRSDYGRDNRCVFRVDTKGQANRRRCVGSAGN